MDTKKLDLFNQIKSFSMPDFPNLHIFSKAFFNELFLKAYENNGIYTLLYGDINGLRKLNDTIGFDKADLAIEELLKTILNYLPNNALSFRVGGDEFCFVIPELSTSETRNLTKQIHTSLSSNPKVNGLDITFGACDSSQFDNVQDMYHFVENRVNLKKHSHLQFDKDATDLNDYNKKLDEFIDYTIKTYLTNFRFSSKRYFTREDLKTLSYPILNSITNLLNNKNTVKKQVKDIHNSSNENVSKVKPNTVETLYELIKSNDFDTDKLSSISTEDLDYVKNCLSIDSITNAYNSVYRDHYLHKKIEDDNIPVQILLAESLGIKISNSVFSHAGTDKRIEYTYNNLFNTLQSLVPEDSDVEIIPIHSGGGTFEFIIKNNNDVITYDDIKKSLYEMSLDSNNFYILGILGNCEHICEYDKVYSKLNKICDIKKNRIKCRSSHFVKPAALELINVSLSSLVNYFKTQSQNLGVYNEQEKIAFTRKVINSLVDNFNELNLANAEIEKKKQNKQFDER